ncbi:MAG: F0F1 ATP synthase subunit delta [Rhodospirillales bacterium]|mgnify:CR=1 FL=1|nr:F0F1 ATP synthase subunit delta [Rhodospirillales bacterium]
MASGQTKISGLSGRYATALFELACDENSIDSIAKDLLQLQKMIDESEDLRRLIESPLFSRDAQSRAMAALTQKAGLSKLVCNTVGVMASNRRLFVIENVIRDFRTLVSDHRGEVEAEITTANELSDAQRAALETALREAIGSSVAITTEIDPNLLGGMVVRVGSRMIDSSLRSKLQRLQLAMKGAA